MTSFRILALSLMAAASIAATAQDEADERSLQWYDMSSLNYAASGSTNPTHVLQQHVLIDDAVMEANQELGQQLITFKYDSYWSYRDGEITMKRFDNQLDILDATTYQVKRTEPVPDEGS